MPEKSLTVATYAAGASLAAITLVYVFAPTYFLDNDKASGSQRKKGVVGLSNPANDCFINSILQALAGLGELRIYLIRETHRRSLDDSWVYAQPVPHDANLDDIPHYAAAVSPRKPVPEWLVLSLQSGAVTQALKKILDQLNERPIYKKTASALPFVREVEAAFRQRISRQQQDAQEFLQIVAERLCDEYHAGRRARRYARQQRSRSSPHLGARFVDEKLGDMSAATTTPSSSLPAATAPTSNLEYGTNAADDATSESQRPTKPPPPQGNGIQEDIGDEMADEGENGFPMEGSYESQIECLTCGFKPRPTEANFCMLTLHVPQGSSTTLNACFDAMFKTEYIDDFKCDKCRLVHARGILRAEAARLTSTAALEARRRDIALLDHAIETDPARNLDGVVKLPDSKYSPMRRIARHIRMTGFPKILSIHLSRSVFERSMSQKNSAKVSFPERLPLGSLLHRRNYKLLGVVTHKGSHHSGHYETFRRQNVYPPYSTPNTFQLSGVYGRSVNASPAATPRIGAATAAPTSTSAMTTEPDGGITSSANISPLASTPDLLDVTAASPSTAPPEPVAESSVRSSPVPKGKEKEKDSDSSSLRSVARSTLSKISSSRPGSRSGSRSSGKAAAATAEAAASSSSSLTSARATPAPTPAPPQPVSSSKHTKREKQSDLWWRLSDDKVKEATTKDVLGMQREVYMLFYELEKDK